MTTESSSSKNRLRDSLEKFITLLKARAVYLGRLEQNQNFSQIQLLEILYVLVKTRQNQKNPYFFPGLEIELPPQGWSHGVPSMPRNLEKVQN